MDAGVAATLVHLRQTGGVVVALRAEAGEAIDAVNTRAPVVTGIDGTVVNIDVTHCSCKAIKYNFKTEQQMFFLKGVK